MVLVFTVYVLHVVRDLLPFSLLSIHMYHIHTCTGHLHGMLRVAVDVVRSFFVVFAVCPHEPNNQNNNEGVLCVFLLLVRRYIVVLPYRGSWLACHLRSPTRPVCLESERTHMCITRNRRIAGVLWRAKHVRREHTERLLCYSSSVALY